MRLVELYRRRAFAGSTPPPPTTYNTEIGGISGTIYTDALLATKLGISVANISNFTIVGSDIKCNITDFYSIPNDAFSFAFLPCTYYTDSDYFVTLIGDRAFYNTNAFENKTADFRNTTSIGDLSFAPTKGNAYLLKSATTILQRAFKNCIYSNTFYIPSCTNLGGSALYNEVFEGIKSGAKIYAHPSLATNNGGAPDGDLAYAITQGAIVRYVTNFTVPSNITDLYIGTVYSTAIQLIFTAPSSTNTIDYYECYANGVLYNKITASGGFVTGLTASTSYDIEVVAVDIFYNKSTVSNSVTQSTNTTSAQPTTGLVSYYKLDEISGTIADDAFGSDDLINTGVSINQSGKVGTAYKSTAATQKLQTTTATAITGNFTLNMWVYVPAAQPQYATPFEVGNYSANSGFGFLFNSNNTIAWRINQIYNNYNQTITYGVWNMITMVYNGTNVKFYVNGVLTSTVAHTTNPNTTQLRTAFYRQDQGQQAICSCDEASIHNTALTQTQIDLIYNAGNGITL